MANTVIMPRLSLNEETSLLAQWYVSEGDSVAVGDRLFCIETDKSTMDVDSEFAGTVLKAYYGDYEVVQVLTPVCVIGEPGEEVPELEIVKEDADAPAAETSESAQTKVQGGNEPASPALDLPADEGKMKGVSPRAKVLAAKNGITEFAVIRPSGADNRILEEDIIRFMENGREPEVRAASGARKVVKFSKIRSIISKNMQNSLQSTAQLTYSNIFNASGVQALRERFKREQGELKNVTIGDLILFAVSRTMAEFPYMNAWMGDDEVIEFADVNLGVAVDTERGLMVPTIPAAQTKSLKEISDELKALAGECREGNIHPSKLQGATFTVSN